MLMLHEIMLWLGYGYVMATATGTSARREAVLWLLCQSGDSKPVCSYCGSLSLLPGTFFFFFNLEQFLFYFYLIFLLLYFILQYCIGFAIH